MYISNNTMMKFYKGDITKEFIKAHAVLRFKIGSAKCNPLFHSRRIFLFKK